MKPLRGHGAELFLAGVLALAVIAAAGVWWATQTRVPAPLPVATAPRPAFNRIFADEAAFVPSVAEYTSPTIGDDYLPISAPAAVRPVLPASQFFRDELAGAGATTPLSLLEMVPPPLMGWPEAGPR
jgi:hypothetical protein